MIQWEDTALPALKAIRELQNASDNGYVDFDSAIAEKLDKPMSEVGPQLRALRDDDYIIVKGEAPSGGNPFGLYAIRLAPRGLRALGDWPSDEIQELVNVFKDAVNKAETQAEKGRLRRLGARIAEVLSMKGLSEAVERTIG